MSDTNIVLRYMEQSPIPVSALSILIPSIATAEQVQLCRLLVDMVQSKDVQKDFFEFFMPVANSHQSRWKHFVIPEDSHALISFSLEALKPHNFLPLLLSVQKWGIELLSQSEAFQDISRIRKISVRAVLSGNVIQENHEGYSIADNELHLYAGSSGRIGDHIRIRRSVVKPVLLVIERREIDIVWQKEDTVATEHLGTECLWYPPFGNKRVVKYLRSALQGAMGQITNPLRLAQLLVKCEVAAPRLREVIFEKNEERITEK